MFLCQRTRIGWAGKTCWELLGGGLLTRTARGAGAIDTRDPGQRNGIVLVPMSYCEV